jgi:hypothetical protein
MPPSRHALAPIRVYIDGVDVTVTKQTLADTSSVLRLGGGSSKSAM